MLRACALRALFLTQASPLSAAIYPNCTNDFALSRSISLVQTELIDRQFWLRTSKMAAHAVSSSLSNFLLGGGLLLGSLHCGFQLTTLGSVFWPLLTFLLISNSMQLFSIQSCIWFLPSTTYPAATSHLSMNSWTPQLAHSNAIQ